MLAFRHLDVILEKKSHWFASPASSQSPSHVLFTYIWDFMGTDNLSTILPVILRVGPAGNREKGMAAKMMNDTEAFRFIKADQGREVGVTEASECYRQGVNRPLEFRRRY